MRWLALLVLLGCFLGGCYEKLPGEVYELPGQAEATQIVWVDSYGMTDAPPPPVFWVTGNELTCDSGYNDWRAFETSRGCVNGDTNPNEGVAVAWEPTRPLSFTSLAHELYHWRQLLRGEDWHSHPADVFARDGLVDRVNAKVREGEVTP